MFASYNKYPPPSPKRKLPVALSQTWYKKITIHDKPCNPTKEKKRKKYMQKPNEKIASNGMGSPLVVVVESIFI